MKCAFNFSVTGLMLAFGNSLDLCEISALLPVGKERVSDFQLFLLIRILVGLIAEAYSEH